MTPVTSGFWILTLALTLIGAGGLASRVSGLALSGWGGALLLAILAARHTEEDWGRRRARSVGLAVLRVLLVAGALVGLQVLLVRAPLHWNLARGQVLDHRPLVAWASRIPGDLEVTVFGPEGHRRVRAALGVVEVLRLGRPGTRVRHQDPARSAPLAGLGRRARLGEVMLAAGGRRALAVDASPRALCGALRGLADPSPRGIRFLADQFAPGAPPGFRRAAAALAGELGVACSAGPPDPGQRLWIWISGHSPDLSKGALRGHLERGGGLLVLLEGEPPGELAEGLAELGFALSPGFLLDREVGPRRDASVLRVRTLEEGSDPALLSGAAPVRAPDEADRLWPLACGEVDQGVDPASGGPRRARAPEEFPGALLEVGEGWVGVVGDADFATKAGLSVGGNRQLLVELGALGMDRLLALPGSLEPPVGNVDPDLAPEVFRTLAFLLLLGLPGVPVLLALACLGGTGGRAREAGSRDGSQAQGKAQSAARSQAQSEAESKPGTPPERQPDGQPEPSGPGT